MYDSFFKAFGQGGPDIDWPCILLMLVLAKRKKLKLLEDKVPRLHGCGQIFTCATRLHRTEQILFQIVVLFAVQKLACFCAGGQEAQLEHSPILPG